MNDVGYQDGEQVANFINGVVDKTVGMKYTSDQLVHLAAIYVSALQLNNQSKPERKR